MPARPGDPLAILREGSEITVRILRGIVFCLLLMAAFVPSAFADVSAEERQAAFAWFDTLGYPDIAHLPLVKFTHLDEGGLGLPRFVPVNAPVTEAYGFLTQKDAKQFSILLFSLGKESLTFRPRTEEKQGIGYDPVGLRNYVEQLIKWQADFESAIALQKHPGFVELFVLARACEGNGLTALAAQLCNMAGNYLPVSEKGGRPLSSLQARLAEVIGHQTFEEIRGDFGTPSIPRVALLSQIELYLKHFLNGADHAKAVEIEKELQRMVVEDQEHAAHAASPNEETSQQNRIDALIFALRDQNGYQNINGYYKYMSVGYADVFTDSRGEKSPAAQLRKIGLPAVPALLEAVTDTRLTRSVGGMDVYPGEILSVGEAAMQILVAIANRGFQVQAASEKEVAVAFQKEARQWWAEVQAHGETQVLLEAVRRGDENSADQARRLMTLDPKLAVSALKEGIRTTNKYWVRQTLVGTLAEFHRPDALPFVKMQLRKGIDLGTRLMAAQVLHEQGDPEAVACMVKEWRRRPELVVKDDALSVDSLMWFLVECGAPEGMRALEEKLQERGVTTRFALVGALFNRGGEVAKGGQKSAAASHAWAQMQQARAAVVQRLLVGLLNDTAVEASGMGIGRYSFQNPRLCDFANATLSELWPHTYHYGNSASLFERDYERVATANLWRSAHGLAPLSFPTRPHIQPAADSLVQPLIQQFVHAASVEERERIGNRIAAIGLPALSAVRNAGQLAAKDPSASEWLALERRLSIVVRQARVESNGVKPNAAVAQQLAAMQGHPLVAKACKDLVISAMKTLPKNADGVKLSLLRDDDGTGFSVVLTLSPSHKPISDTARLTTYYHLEGGGESTGSDVRDTPARSDVDESSLMNLFQRLDRALECDPYTLISLEVAYKYQSVQKE
ncbi:MAG: hypothetical protein JWL77_3810 [Chthonomonadaceae bacterium]|nr:hypothetical protein [Chthonomonadaceae bacterium]